MKKEYIEKIYASFLGMNIGIRLGAPVEPAFWSEENIERYYGDIRGYVKDYKHFAADDDANGPVFFLRALDDMEKPGEPKPEDIAEAWLNYAREGIGLYWWGGYGISTEHTAYLNLKSGIPAPRSGSIEQNGKTLAEQIGGQIFIDTWGMICPGDPERAARYATTAASVSHDGEGLYGAAFMAAAIAKAFDTPDVTEIIRCGLDQIPRDSLYRAVFDAVAAFHEAHPEEWRACLHMLQREWGYDRYPGVCHIIPNAGVCALALYYGNGDFSRTVEIATMCSWDTDCNAGNVGSILGATAGLQGIPAHYRDPINDEIVLSGISGYLNILDIPTYCRKLARLGDILAGREPDAAPCPDGEFRFDFSLPGSTHGFKVSDPFKCIAKHSDEHGGSFGVFFPKMTRGETCDISLRTFYRRRDFNDERYMPVFSPLACPGMDIAFRIAFEQTHGEAVSLIPYAKETYSGKVYEGKPVIVNGSEEDIQIRWSLPDTDGGIFEEVGLRFTSLSAAKVYDSGTLYLKEYHLSGKADYTLDPALSRIEFGSVLPFSHNHGAWTLADGKIEVMSLGHAEAVTGNYFAGNQRFDVKVTPLSGGSHLIGIRIQGARRGIYAGLGIREGKKVILIGKNDRGIWHDLNTKAYDWHDGTEYDISLTAEEDHFTLAVNGESIAVTDPEACTRGMVGLARYESGRTAFGTMHIKEL